MDRGTGGIRDSGWEVGAICEGVESEGSGWLHCVEAEVVLAFMITDVFDRRSLVGRLGVFGKSLFH